ncbi:MAG: 30S ribosomal protein S21 [Candidatus Methylomirabilales bacterium]
MPDQQRKDEGQKQPRSTSLRLRPVEVAVDSRGVEPALRVFKQLVLRHGILREVKRKRYYEKPGERRRRKARDAARRRWRQFARARPSIFP